MLIFWRILFIINSLFFFVTYFTSEATSPMLVSLFGVIISLNGIDRELADE